VNKIIWTYWHQGFDQAPWLVKICVGQWQKMNPNWTVHLLDANTIHEFVEPLPIKTSVIDKMLLPHRSDLIRTQLLIKYGGVWADPTTFCTTSLDSWINKTLSSGIFLFRNPARDRIIANWFIAATPNHPFLIQLLNGLYTYWDVNDFKNYTRKKHNFIDQWANRLLNRNLDWPLLWFSSIITKGLRIFPYMVYHYKFYELYKNKSNMRIYLDKMPFQSADGPHLLKRAGLLNPITLEIKNWIDSQNIPVYKLVWDIESEEDVPSNSVLSYLLSTSKK